MIPLRLQLKNFLSYGPELQTIDFTPYHLICLCGKNGHGKSALLDAMTWALWGTARKLLSESKPDYGLLRLGQTQMQVTFDFSCNGQVYRVRREFAKTYGKPLAVLEFGIIDAHNAFVALTDKSIRTTQAKIITTLNLTAESFMNSAFIRQGNANEFSQKIPKDRKKVLAHILGLAKYDQLRRLAQEAAKGLQLKQQAMNGSLNVLIHELVPKQSITQRSHTITQELETLTHQEVTLLQQLHELDEAKQMLMAHQHKLQTAHTAHAHNVHEQQHKQPQLRETWHAWRTLHKQLYATNCATLEAERQEIVTWLAQYQEQAEQRFRAQEKILNLKASMYTHEQTIVHEYEQTCMQLELATQKFHIEYKHLLKQIDTIDITLQQQENVQREYTQEQEILTQKLQKKPAFDARLQAFDQQFLKRKNYYQMFIAQGTWVTQQLEDIRKKQLLVHDESNPSCPLCEQNLSAARKRFLKKSFCHQEQALMHRCARLKKIVVRLKQVLLDQHTERTTLGQQEQEYSNNTIRHAALVKEHALLLNTYAENIAHHATLTQNKHELLQSIHHHEQKITATRARIPTLIKQDLQHQAMHKELQGLTTLLTTYTTQQQQYSAFNNRLKIIQEQITAQRDTTATQQERMMTTRRLCHELKVLKKNIQEQQSIMTESGNIIAVQEKVLQEKMPAVMHAIKQLRTHKETLIKEQGQVEQQLHKITAIEQEHAQRLQDIAQLDGEIADYNIIATTLGKDGLQALLIEEAIPEIEHEANKILAKLTDNQTHIFLESLKDLKSGGTKETLDIRVSDSMGLRPYEMFSGGEAFRIDFALRVGIAKLLAHRAGTSLQTLIIDEGFGSQDEDGLQLIMDVLHRIQDDFAKIIIVSHLNAMKNQFPVHFLVQKKASGSTVDVVEQA